jgi:hypothetical protein
MTTRALVLRFAVSSVALAGLLACFRPPPPRPVLEPVGRPPGFDAAAREAYWNVINPGKAEYYNLINRQLGEQYRDSIKSCRWDNAETRGTTILYKLDAEGKKLDYMVFPMSHFANCMLETLDEYEFPPPPRPDYWVRVDVGACPAPSVRTDCFITTRNVI